MTLAGSISLAVIIALNIGFGSATTAKAANIVYVHGRSMQTWPPAGRLLASSAWNQVSLTFDGSVRLGDETVRNYIEAQIKNACTTTDCIVVCYSTGCARTLLAYHDLERDKAANEPFPRILFTEALASSAGGTELAAYSTNNNLRLLAKMYFANPPPPAESIDYDLPPDNMRTGAWSIIQGAARAPVYHLAGRNNICHKTKIRGYVMAVSTATWVLTSIGVLPAGPIGWVIDVFNGFGLFGSGKVSLCGNRYFPGGYGDGIVPVHSAAGYASGGEHANHADGTAKYPFRAYEQVALFDRDHQNIFEPGVIFGSSRLAVTSATARQCIDDATNKADTGEIPASIVYEDADGPIANTINEVSPSDLLKICGNDMFASSTDKPLYATCNGPDGCCDKFSTGPTSPCKCGEGLCIQAGFESISYFTGDNCSGYEYSPGGYTWDGMGMVGTLSQNITIRSVRKPSQACLQTTKHIAYKGCDEYVPVAKSLSARRVYRPLIDQYGPNPQGSNEFPGYPVALQKINGYCP